MKQKTNINGIPVTVQIVKQYFYYFSCIAGTYLARCMLEKGVDDRTAIILLEGLPDTFDAWKTRQPSSPGQSGAV